MLHSMPQIDDRDRTLKSILNYLRLYGEKGRRAAGSGMAAAAVAAVVSRGGAAAETGATGYSPSEAEMLFSLAFQEAGFEERQMPKIFSEVLR